MSKCDNFQRTKRSNKKYGKFPAKLSEEIPWNEIFLDLIGTYSIIIKDKKENIHLKAVMIIDHVTEWFEIAQYEDKIAISIMKLVENTWLSI